MEKVEYVQGSDLPDLALSWFDYSGAIIDFTSGYSFELKLGKPGSPALVTKTTGFTALLTDPNLIVSWASTGELNSIAVGEYRCQIRATRIADNKQRTTIFWFVVLPGIL